MGTVPRNLLDAKVVQLKDLEGFLECPVCISVPRSGPIIECPNGHLICGTCAEGIPERKCPICRVIFSVDKRSRLAENIIGKCDFEVPCIHAGRGCEHVERKSMIEEHEAGCGSRPVKCLDEDCDETMNFDQFLSHSELKHAYSQTETTGDTITNSFLLEDTLDVLTTYTHWKTNTSFVLHGKSFITILWKKDNTFHAMLYILASKEVAEKYRVNISISGKDYNVNYTTNVVSIDTLISEAKDNEENSLSLTNLMAKKCISRNEDEDVLKFHFKVLQT